MVCIRNLIKLCFFLRYLTAKTIGKLGYFYGQDRLVRFIYSPDSIYQNQKLAFEFKKVLLYEGGWAEWSRQVGVEDE